MTFVSDIDAGDEYFVPTASVHQRQAIERVGPSTHEASTNRSYAEAVVDDQTRGEVLDVTEDDIEVSIPGTPVDPTLLTSYFTHVVALIW